jgi:hypothetical protein
MTEPTQPLTDDPLAGMRRRLDAYTGPDHYRFTIDGIEYDGHWAHDARRALAEVDRLRHENEHHRRYRYTAEQNAYYASQEARELREEMDALLPLASPHRTTKADRKRNWLHGSWESFAARAKPARAAANRWAREADRLEEWAAKRKAEADAGEWPPCQGCDEHPAINQEGNGNAKN